VKMLEERCYLGANQDLGPRRPSRSWMKLRPSYEGHEM
jgi:hypothetical protein